MTATACRYETIAVEFTQEERELVAYHAEQATLPAGYSDIFEGTEEELERRELERGENQYVGMGVEAALSKWGDFLGTGGFNAFVARRELRNQNKFAGDNGIDLHLFDGRVPVDAKGSEPTRGRVFNEDTAMRLCLTHKRKVPLEKMRDIVYVFGLTERAHGEACLAPYVVLLVGWLWGYELYGREDRAFLKGWSAVGSSLRKMHTLQNCLQAKLPVAPLIETA
jgi:hypothetical protein